MNVDERRAELVRVAAEEWDDTRLKILLSKVELPDDTVKEVDYIWLTSTRNYEELGKELKTEAILLTAKESLEKYNVLQLAAYLSRYAIVWWLIQRDWGDESKRKAAIEVAQMNRHSNKLSQVSYSTTIDVLKDPPLIEEGNDEADTTI